MVWGDTELKLGSLVGRRVGFLVGRRVGFLDGRLLLRAEGLFVGLCFEGFLVGRLGVGFIDGLLEVTPLILAKQKRPLLIVPVDGSTY